MTISITPRQMMQHNPHSRIGFVILLASPTRFSSSVHFTTSSPAMCWITPKFQTCRKSSFLDMIPQTSTLPAFFTNNSTTRSEASTSHETHQIPSSSSSSSSPSSVSPSRRTFCVRFEGTEMRVKENTLLRTALLQHGSSPHNVGAQFINCRGLGTCGTCAVEIRPLPSSSSSSSQGVDEDKVDDGDDSICVSVVTPMKWNAREKLRLNFYPHKTPANARLRLACQVRIKGDLEVIKYEGFWGQEEMVRNQRQVKEKQSKAPLGELEYILDSEWVERDKQDY